MSTHETSGATEEAYRMVEHSVRRYLRRVHNVRKHTDVPHWHHRKVRYEHLGNGVFKIELRGRFSLPIGHFGRSFDVQFRARLRKQRGCLFPFWVAGLMQEHWTMPVIRIKHRF